MRRHLLFTIQTRVLFHYRRCRRASHEAELSWLRGGPAGDAFPVTSSRGCDASSERRGVLHGGQAAGLRRAGGQSPEERGVHPPAPERLLQPGAGEGLQPGARPLQQRS